MAELARSRKIRQPNMARSRLIKMTIRRPKWSEILANINSAVTAPAK